MHFAFMAQVLTILSVSLLQNKINEAVCIDCSTCLFLCTAFEENHTRSVSLFAGVGGEGEGGGGGRGGWVPLSRGLIVNKKILDVANESGKASRSVESVARSCSKGRIPSRDDSAWKWNVASLATSVRTLALFHGR